MCRVPCFAPSMPQIENFDLCVVRSALADRTTISSSVGGTLGEAGQAYVHVNSKVLTAGTIWGLNADTQGLAIRLLIF